MLVLGNPATSFSILIGSIPSDPLYALSANQQRLYERCYTSEKSFGICSALRVHALNKQATD
jgi:hypothetical protein